MVVDFHSHILPKIDDGSSSLRESLKMLRREAKQEIRHVIATPHFYPMQDSPQSFLERRRAAELRLREGMKKYEDLLPTISVGAEVAYFPGMSESDILSDLTIAGTEYILIEMPAPPWTGQMYDELKKIRMRQGLIPIIAHVDRYISPLRTYRIPEKLEELPVMVQANASFFTRKLTESIAMRLLKADRIHVLGSDCHNLKDRAPNLGMAVQKIARRLGQEAIKKINLYEDEILHWKKG